MPKFFCDYCDVYLTHDSMSVRKAHNSGRNHLRNVVDYYQRSSPSSTSFLPIDDWLTDLGDSSRNWPRKGPVRHRLHHLFLRRRGPGPCEPDASSEPTRPRIPAVWIPWWCPSALPRHARSSPRTVPPRSPASSWWSRHASFSPGPQRNASDASSQRPPISSPGRPSLPSPRRSRRTWSPPAKLPRHACAGTARLPSSRTRRLAAWFPRWRTSCSWTGQAVMHCGWRMLYIHV